jgi:(4S)-4-hydroxy-5-phosphonooxypentane-2,3-dione isomerase
LQQSCKERVCGGNFLQVRSMKWLYPANGRGVEANFLLPFEVSDVAKFAIVATIEVTPGQRDQLLPLLKAHRARCLKDEPGTLQFEILLPKDDDTKVLLHEVYRDDAAFEVHRNGPSLARWQEETAGMVAKLYGTRCEVLD